MSETTPLTTVGALKHAIEYLELSTQKTADWYKQNNYKFRGAREVAARLRPALAAAEEEEQSIPPASEAEAGGEAKPVMAATIVQDCGHVAYRGHDDRCVVPGCRNAAYIPPPQPAPAMPADKVICGALLLLKPEQRIEALKATSELLKRAEAAEARCAELAKQLAQVKADYTTYVNNVQTAEGRRIAELEARVKELEAERTRSVGIVFSDLLKERDAARDRVAELDAELAKRGPTLEEALRVVREAAKRAGVPVWWDMTAWNVFTNNIWKKCNTDAEAAALLSPAADPLAAAREALVEIRAHLTADNPDMMPSDADRCVAAIEAALKPLTLEDAGIHDQTLAAAMAEKGGEGK